VAGLIALWAESRAVCAGKANFGLRKGKTAHKLERMNTALRHGRSVSASPSGPIGGLAVGSDRGPVGDYSAPNPFTGKIENVTVRFP